jgi:DNA replication protein DnaC
MSEGYTPSIRALNEADMERMKVPRRFWKTTSGGIQDKRVRNKISKYLEDLDRFVQDGIGMVLSGENGVGKTSAAVYLLKEIRKRGFSCLFLEAAKLKALVIEHTPFDDEQTLWERAAVVDFLLLDDLWKGTKDSKSFGDDLLDELLRTRSGELRPTLITTNTSIIKAVQSGIVKPSMLSLLQETAALIEFNGHDLRTEKHAAINDMFR